MGRINPKYSRREHEQGLIGVDRSFISMTVRILDGTSSLMHLFTEATR